MSLVVLKLVVAVGFLTMRGTLKALEAKVAKLEADLAEKCETNAAAASSHSPASSRTVLADLSLDIKP